MSDIWCPQCGFHHSPFDTCNVARRWCAKCQCYHRAIELCPAIITLSPAHLNSQEEAQTPLSADYWRDRAITAEGQLSTERKYREELAQQRALVGIRDLELDALAPNIAEIATRLLKSSGDSGRIQIETTRTSSGSAKRAKQIEDFLIFYTGEDGEQQDIATCSGGEMVWQRKALYDAFAVMRSRNAGLKFSTCLLDETDGALHPTRKQDYFRMLEAAHRESDRYQTVLITQSSELAAMAQTVIDVTTLGPREAKAEEVAA